MSSQCPSDTSTEAVACLLRLVADNTQPSWNWDPLNFGVTAAIGFLALIIACITVFQGLLAAGPGRIKASSQAIGPFSIHSQSRLDRTELALRTTARVPLITWDVCYHRIVRQKFQPNFEAPGSHSQLHPSRLIGTDPFAARDQANGNLARDRATHRDESLAKERHQYDSTATWLNLLTSLGLDDPQFFPLVQRVTDYLPADVQAAPAAGELRCLAILAVIADSNASIELSGPGNRFPRVLADSSQLVFRDHPSIGTVAAYEAYEETAILKVGAAPPLEFGTQFPALNFEELDRCLQLASGRLAYADGRIPPSPDKGQADSRTFLILIKDLWERSRGCGHDVCENAYGDWEASLRNMQERKDGWTLFGQLKKFYMVTSLMTADRANLCRGFPKERMKLRESITAMLDLDKFWSTDMTFQKAVQLQKLAYLTFWSSRWVPFGSKLSASWVVDFTSVQSTISNPFSEGFKVSERQHFKEDMTMQIMQAVRSAVTKWVVFDKESPEAFDTHKLSAQSIAMLLACLDEWLLRCGGGAASCSMLKLLHSLGAQTQIGTTARHDEEQDATFWSHAREKPGAKSENSHSYNSLDPGKVNELVRKFDLDGFRMSTLLVLRGVLLALLLDDGADTSVLYEPQFRNSVVRML